MKNFKYLLLALLCVMCLSGCGKKTLTCTDTNNEDGIKSIETIKFKFKKNKIKSFNVSVENEATDDSIKNNWDTFVSMLESTFKVDEETKGITVKTDSNDKKYTYSVSVDVDLDKIEDEDALGFDLEEMKKYENAYDEIKSELEKEGYTCK